LRRTAQRFTPAAIGDEMSGRVRALGTDVRDALREGRQAMVAREAQLRAELVSGAPSALPASHSSVPRPDPNVIELSTAKGRGRHPRTSERRRSPAVPWADHGHERPSARLS